MNVVFLVIVGVAILYVYFKHDAELKKLDQLAQDIYKTKDLAITMPQASDLSKDIQDKTGVITSKIVTVFDKKQLTLKIEASNYTITVILDKNRNVVRIDVKNRGIRNMTKVDFTMADLQPMSLGYEEGQDVTPEVLKRAEKAYQYFHNKYLELVASGVDKELRDLLIFHDASLEDFVGRVRQVAKSGYYYDSMGVFSVYLEYNDTYAELRDYLNSRGSIDV